MERGGYPHPIQPQMQTTYVTAPPAVGPTSSRITCTSCGNVGMTDLRHESTTKTHIIALLLCIFGCIPCVCIPYCVDSCRNANHYCPSCNAFIGTYQS